MSEFRVTAVETSTQNQKIFLYDNQTSTISYDGIPIDFTELKKVWPVTKNFTDRSSADQHKSNIKVLKIQLGLSCNYSCSYCSQRFVPHADETSKKHVEPFLKNLSNWFNGGETGKGISIQFWGGEPFVYWKTLKPLAEALYARYPDAEVWFPTNGSLLDLEKNGWIEKMGYSISISHDGPGQYVRGPDPFDNPTSRTAILDLFGRLHPKGKISFNACMNSENQSRASVVQFFKNVTGCEDVRVGEGAFIDPYDEGSMAKSLNVSELRQYSMKAFEEIRSGKVTAANMLIIKNKVNSFIGSILNGRPLTTIGQKCSMDRAEHIAVDLRGNVLTCQNVSSSGVAANGNSHLIGSVDNFSSIKLNTITHWRDRKDCSNCPVIQLCGGSCMFLGGRYWEQSCENSFADNIPFFAEAFELLTGCVPVKIEGGRKDRELIWGQEP